MLELPLNLRRSVAFDAAGVAPAPRGRPAFRPGGERRAVSAHAFRTLDHPEIGLTGIVAELTDLQDRLATQHEVLKLVGIYAGEDWLRLLARSALDDPDLDVTALLPDSLFDARLATGCDCCTSEPTDG